jgi:hypothetical protein
LRSKTHALETAGVLPAHPCRFRRPVGFLPFTPKLMERIPAGLRAGAASAFAAPCRSRAGAAFHVYFDERLFGVYPSIKDSISINRSTRASSILVQE